MKKLKTKITKIYKDLSLKENEEKAIICIIVKDNQETLESEVLMYVNGNKIVLSKIVNELMKNEEAKDFSQVINQYLELNQD